jgi:hypothetical protein
MARINPHVEHAMTTTCPCCGTVNEVATSLFIGMSPQDGDASMCFRCGIISVFDHTAPGHQRKPDAIEQAMFNTDPRIQKLIDAWHATRKGTKH